MASSRKYKCIYCDKSYERNELAVHIDKNHSDMLNYENGYTANRIVFDICNRKTPIGNGKGSCRECKKQTNWNEKNVRYEPFCSDACRKQAREKAVNNMLRVHHVKTLLGDEAHQEKMLANRSISGKYKWSDGTYKTYVGSYEKKFLEFMDKALQVDSKDLLTPGPVIEYEFNGEKHKWITDAWYIPYNLVFDIKDGGSNKNTREMPEYRAKQDAKETMITDQGIYNYIRLTDNDFLQLMEIFAELKRMYLDEADPKTISRINEGGPSIGGALPPAGATDMNPHAYVVNYMQSNSFGGNETGFALSNNITSDYMIHVDKDGKLKKKKTSDLIKENTSCKVYRYIGENVSEILKEVFYKYKNEITVDQDYIPKILTEFEDILSDDQLDYSYLLEEVNLERYNEQYHTNLESLQFQLEMACNKTKTVFPVLDPVKYEQKKSILREYEDITILEGLDSKFFALNTITGNRTRSVDNITDISKTLLDTIRTY